MIRLGFFGTPALAATVLIDILGDARFEVVFVVTNPDKPFGRDQVMKPSPVKDVAIAHGVPLYQPLKIRNNTEFLADIRSYDCDYFVVVAYGKIFPLELLEIPHKRCINIHGSILPKYRGASPIQSALLHGETMTGVTIMEMSEGMDEGDILKIREIPIESDETTTSLFDKFAVYSGSALLDTISELEHGGITPLPQDHARATYCKKIEKEEGLIDWTHSAKEIYQKWQAYTPWPGIYTIYEEKRLQLEKVTLLGHADAGKIQDSTNSDMGHVIKLDDGRIGIVCGDGVLTIHEVKLEGKKSQSIKDFVNGNQGFIDTIL